MHRHHLAFENLRKSERDVTPVMNAVVYVLYEKELDDIK